MIAMLLGPLGAGDCERILETGLIQPVNAWSSLAYSVVGIAVAIYARSVHGRERSYRIVFGTLLIATGIGSFLYHGPQSAGAGFTHDITFLATLWFLILVHAGSALRRTGGVLWMLFGVAVATISVVLLIAPSSTNVITGLSVIALVGSDVSLHRNGRINGRLYATALVLFAGALVANLLGRTGVSTCDPASYLQFHGLWHVLSALALGVYFLATTGPRNQVPRP